MSDQKTRIREWQKAHPDRRREHQNAYIRKHPERYLWRRAKSRAARDGLDFSITPEDIVIPTHCPVLGLELKINSAPRGQGRAGGCSNSMSLDRMDSTRGYVKGNLMVMSQLANAMKNSATPEELLRFAEWITQRYSK